MSFEKELDILEQLDQMDKEDEIVLGKLKDDINDVLGKLKQAESDSYV